MSQNLMSVEICKPDVVQSLGSPAFVIFSSSIFFYLSLSLVSTLEAIVTYKFQINIKHNLMLLNQSSLDLIYHVFKKY